MLSRPTISVKHTISDTAKLINALNQLGRKHVKNGVLTGIGAHPDSESGATVASIAAWNEFGTPHISSRPFMRLSYVAFKKDTAFVIRALRKCLLRNDKRVSGDAKIGDFFNVCGLRIQQLMLERIDNGISFFKGGAESTVAAKEEKGGSDTPLFDTGILKKSLSFAVEENR
jgi:hypothetical protein